MTTKTAALALRNSDAYRASHSYSDVVEQIIRGTWTPERVAVEVECIDRRLASDRLRGWTLTTDKSLAARAACTDVLAAL